MFRITLSVRFRHRGESQINNVKKPLNIFTETRDDISLNGLIATADRSCESMFLLKTFAVFDIDSIMIMLQHRNRCHPFVGRSFLRASRMDECNNGASEIESSSSNTQAVNRAGTHSMSAQVPKIETNSDKELLNGTQQHNKSSSNYWRDGFIVEDSGDSDLAALFARKQIRTYCSGKRQRQVTAGLVRDCRSAEYSNILTFLYEVPPDFCCY